MSNILQGTGLQKAQKKVSTVVSVSHIGTANDELDNILNDQINNKMLLFFR